MYKLIKPFLFKIEPEKAHGLTIDALKTLQKFPVLFPVVDKLFTYKNPTLSQTIQGNTYDNPIGLANWFRQILRSTKSIGTPWIRCFRIRWYHT